MTDAKLKTIRRFVAWSFVKIALTLAVLFVLVRVAIPGLINAHDDAFGVLALLFGLATPVIAGWVAVSLFLSVRRFTERLGNRE